MAGTIAPIIKHQFLDTNGAPLAAGLLYTYAAGTTTPLAAYQDADLAVAWSNPIELDAAGRATIFLGPSAYKFVLKSEDSVTQWTVDGVGATPSTNVSLDVAGTAGEALDANDAVYLSSGAGGTTAGRWYKTDSDAAATSSTPGIVAFAAADVGLGASGSIRLQGRMEGFAGLVAGSKYYVGATPGSITITAPANTRFVGVADSVTSLMIVANPLFEFSGLTVTGDVTIGGTLSVTGASSLGATSVTGLLTVVRNLSSAFTTTFANTSATGYGVAIQGGGPANFGLRVQNYDASIDALLLTGSGVATVANRVQATLQPGFLAYNPALVAGVATGTTVAFGTESYDRAANYNNTAYIFTAPVAGDYLFIASIYATASSAAAEVGLKLNTTGGTYLLAERAPGNTLSSVYGGSAMVRMTAGDTAYVTVEVSTGTVDVLGSATGVTTFSGRLLP